jgi:hypothetical protein
MFVNKVPFFVTISREIKFGTVESIPNRQVTTIKNCLTKVMQLYSGRRLIVGAILADHEFELIRPWYPNLNTTTADEHVPDIERHIRTVKERTRSTYTMLPYRHLPRIALVPLVKNAVFWLNAFPTNDGVSTYPHTLEADDSGVIRWWIDASFAVHPDMKSHTGAAMSMGKECAYAVSR